MLSAACPSCGAPIRFAHAVAVATVCSNCRSTVVRRGDDLKQAGKASVFPRDLSPIQLGARGKVDGRGFMVAGVLRKERERVRWNEWFCVYDDGRLGWIGEGNGELQLYDQSFDAAGAPAQDECRPGYRVKLRDRKWQVLESATAAITAADGELPLAATDGMRTGYVDLRIGDGKTCATLDHSFDPPLLYTGRIVQLKELNLDRIRPITGWSDPDLQAAFSGPELQGTTALTCPNCTGDLQLHSPEAENLVCRYCGSVLDLAQTDAKVVRSVDGISGWEPSIPLGSRGKLEGTEWEVIGVMERYVESYGSRWPWTEYFLFNPFHGYRWLAEDGTTGHWNFIQRLPDLPDLGSSGYSMRHGDHSYKHFQGGIAVVGRVMGEFTWEIRQNDTVRTADYVDPPWMLSLEDEQNERVAALGRWLASDEVAKAFPDAKPYRPRGIAPNQPNPYDSTGTILGFTAGTGFFAIAGLVLFLLQMVIAADDTVLEHSHVASGVSGERWVTEPFEVPDTSRRTLTVEVDSTIDPDHGIVHVSLLNQDDGTALHVRPGRTKGSDSVWNPPPGPYVGVVEVATDNAVHLANKPVRIEVVHDKPYWLPMVVLFILAVSGPIVWYAGRAFFESQRWANSDHA